MNATTRRIILVVSLCLVLVLCGIAGWRTPRPAPEPPRLSGAAEGMEFLARQRAYPHPDLPPRGYAEAFEFVRDKMASAPAAKAGEAPWTPLGPLNTGGRTLCVAFNPQNPQTVWAGSASGGVWRSFTGGVGVEAWQRIDTGHPVLGVSSIAFAPGDSSVVFIGTGEVYAYSNTQGGLVDRLTRGSFGIGVLRSTDGGATWVKSLDWSYDQRRGVQVVKVDPGEARTVWAGTTIGMFRSRDLGATWQQVNTIPMITDLVIHPARPDTMILAAGNLGSQGRGLYRSTDGGDTWQLIVAPGVIPATYLGKALLSMCEADPDVVYASIGNGGLGASQTWLVKSIDAGESWTLRSTTDYAAYQGWFSHDVAVHPEVPTTVLAVGIDIWKSTGSGSGLVRKSDWDLWYFGKVPVGGPEGPPQYSHADHHDVVFHPVDRSIVYFANDGGVFRSLDGGETFAGCNGGYMTAQFYPGFSSSQTDPGWALGGLQDNSTAIYDGDGAWARAIGGDGSCTGIAADDDAVIYGSAQYLQMFRSEDAGQTWTDIYPPTHGTTAFIAPYALGGPAEPDVIYAGRDVIYKSLDRGETWAITNGGSPLDFNPVLAIAVSQTDSRVAYATTAPGGNGGGIFRTLDGGGWWQRISEYLPIRYAPGLAIDPQDDHTVCVVYSGFGTSHAYRSTDAGDTWQDIGAGLPDVPASAVIVDPLDRENIYVGTDLGVFASVTAGRSWFRYSAGLPEAVMVMDLTISPADRMLRAATHGNGTWQRPLLAPVSGTPGPVVAAARPVLTAVSPNPFNPRTEVVFELPRDGRVRLTVHDLAGRLVRTLVDGRREAGPDRVSWDGTDRGGRPVPAGVYLLRLEAGGLTDSRRATLVR